jgi:hypothetical protein
MKYKNRISQRHPDKTPFNPFNHSRQRPPAVRNGNTALHNAHHTTGMTTFSEQIHVAWLSFRTQNFLSHFISCFFFCGSFYIIRPLFSFFFQPLTIIQSVQRLGLEPASRDFIPGNDKIFIFHKASIHCDEIIAIAITSFFRFWRKRLKDLHEA